MASRTESQARSDEDIVLGEWHVCVLHIMHHHKSPVATVRVRDDNRLKALFFPDLIPIFIRRLSLRITDFDPGQEEVLYRLPHQVLVPNALLNVSRQAAFGLAKRLEANLGKIRRQDIRSLLAERTYLASHFEVSHNIYNNV